MNADIKHIVASGTLRTIHLGCHYSTERIPASIPLRTAQTRAMVPIRQFRIIQLAASLRAQAQAPPRVSYQRLPQILMQTRQTALVTRRTTGHTRRSRLSIFRH